jgi:hypothetical protein
MSKMSEYVNLYMKYLLHDSIQKQFEYFERGFKYLCDTPAFKVTVTQNHTYKFTLKIPHLSKMFPLTNSH